MIKEPSDMNSPQNNPYAPGTTAGGVFENSGESEADGGEASVSFLLTTDDYIAFHSRNYRWGFRKYAWGMIALVLAGLWALQLLTPMPGSAASAVNLLAPVIPFQTLIVLTAILLITPVLSPLLIRRQLHAYYENIIRSLSVTIGPDGVRVRSDVSDLFYRWAGIARIVTTPDHFFLQMNRYQSFIVPRRAFRSDAQSTGSVGPAEAAFARILRKYGPDGSSP